MYAAFIVVRHLCKPVIPRNAQKAHLISKALWCQEMYKKLTMETPSVNVKHFLTENLQTIVFKHLFVLNLFVTGMISLSSASPSSTSPVCLLYLKTTL